MKICSFHNVPVVNKSGISKKTGKAYNFDACPLQTADGGYCNAPIVESPIAQPSTGNPTSSQEFSRSLGHEEKVDWDAKDRQSMAQTAMKSASEIVAALIAVGAYDTTFLNEGDFKTVVESYANDFYKQLRKMKNTEL